MTEKTNNYTITNIITSMLVVATMSIPLGFGFTFGMHLFKISLGG